MCAAAGDDLQALLAVRACGEGGQRGADLFAQRRCALTGRFMALDTYLERRFVCGSCVRLVHVDGMAHHCASHCAERRGVQWCEDCVCACGNPHECVDCGEPMCAPRGAPRGASARRGRRCPPCKSEREVACQHDWEHDGYGSVTDDSSDASDAGGGAMEWV